MSPQTQWYRCRMSDLQLEGVYVPVVTPFDADEGLDLSTLTKVIDFCLDGGLRRGVVRNDRRVLRDVSDERRR